MNIFALFGCAVVACVLIITVKQHRADIASVLSIAAGVIMFAYIIPDLSAMITAIYGFADVLNGFSDEMSAIVKALGVCVVAQLASDICRDSGQSTIASRVELGGRAAVLVMLFPVFGRILDAVAVLTEVG